jgi:cell division protein FtsL
MKLYDKALIVAVVISAVGFVVAAFVTRILPLLMR